MCLGVCAVTRRNKLLCGALSVLIAAQLSVGIYFAAVDGTGPSEFLNRLFVPMCMLSHRPSVQLPPEINLDVYNICRHRWPAVVAFSSVSVAFGTSLSISSDFRREFASGALMSFVSRAPLCCSIADLFTFLIILVTARGPRTNRFPGIPTILDAILRDATIYVLVMAAAQLLFLFSLFAPVGHPYYIKRPDILTACAHSEANPVPTRAVGLLP